MPEVRPIDANALREEFKRGVNVVNGVCNVAQILHNIDTAPTLDYEPVVRCKDCEHHYYSGAGVMFCRKVYSLRVTENHFCGWGRAKETKSDSELNVKRENVRGG